MADIKWSSFPDEGTITTGDETVGLRAGANVRLTSNEFNTLTAFGQVKAGSSGSTGFTTDVQLAKDSTASALVISSYMDVNSAPTLYLYASNSTTVGGLDPKNPNDQLGQIYFGGPDGTNAFESGSIIRGRADGAISTGVIPGKLEFLTTAAAGAATLGMSLDSEQVVKIGSSTTAVPGSTLQVAKDNTQGVISVSKYTTASQGAMLYLMASRGATVGDVAAVGSSDILGDIYFSGTDGTGNTTGSLIRGGSDGTVSAGVIPSNLQFFTNDAAGAGQIGMTLDSEQALTTYGQVKIGSDATAHSSVNLRVAKDSIASNIRVSDYSGAATGGYFQFMASGGTTVNSMTAVSDGDIIGNTYYYATDGAGPQISGLVRGTVDGAVSAGIVPGKLEFHTANTSGTNTLGMTLDSAQKLTLVEDMEVNGVTVGTGSYSSSTNVAVGSGALDANVNAPHNVAIGENALGALDSGERNTVIGSGAGATMTDGIKNVLVGSYAGTTSNGLHNVLLGTYCAQSLTTGSDNIMVGYNIGNGTSGIGAILTGASENVFIGREASVDAVDGSGCIALGYQAVAAASNGATSSDNGPGLALGSSAAPVGFRGDGTIFPDTSAPTLGYLRIKINGTNYKLALLDDA